MKVLVAYMSNTGNTKKIADAIYEEIKEEKEIKPVDTVESLDGYDVAFLGFPVRQMGPDKKTAKIIEKHCTVGRNVVLFITHAAPEDSPNLPPMLEKFMTAAGGANVIDMFDCRGELDKTTKRIMSMLPSSRLRNWAKTDDSQGQPDDARIERARAFSRDIMASLRAVEKGSVAKEEILKIPVTEPVPA